MPGPAFLRGEEVTLTPIEEEDLPFLQRLVNEPAIRTRVGAHASKNAQQEDAWFEQANEAEDAEHLLICVEDDDAGATNGGASAISVGDDGTDTAHTDADNGTSADVSDDISAEGYGPVGTVGLQEIDGTQGGGEVGYFVAPGQWGNGYATEAVELVCEYAFDERRLHKVTAQAFAHNAGSRRVLEKAGFVEEGVHREDAFVGGEYVDTVHYGLLAHERDEER